MTIFSRIVAGEIPCYKIAEDEHYLAFLDISPLKEAHTLVIPKMEVDYIFDLSNETLSGLTVFAKKIAIAIEKTVKCNRVAVVVLGLEVPHAHIHLIPINNEADASFFKERLTFTQEQFMDIANRIKNNL